MTILFVVVPVLFFACLGLVLATRAKGPSGFEADLAAFQGQLGALAPTDAGDTPIDPTDSPRSVIDYPRHTTATDHRS